MPKEVFGNLNQIIQQGNKKEFSPSKEEWQRHSAESIEKFLQALKNGFLVDRYNEYVSGGKYLTVLVKGEEKVELYEEYSWGPMLTVGSEDNENRLIKYLERLQTTIGNLVKTLPDHLL